MRAVHVYLPYNMTFLYFFWSNTVPRVSGLDGLYPKNGTK